MKNFFSVFILSGVLLSSPIHAKSKSDIIVNGSYEKATNLLSSDLASEKGIIFLNFSLNFGPTNTKVLVLKGKVDSGISPKKLSPTVEDEQYVDSLISLSKNLKRIKKEKRSILYLYMAQLVSPSNEYVLAELTKYKIKNGEISFSELIPPKEIAKPKPKKVKEPDFKDLFYSSSWRIRYANGWHTDLTPSKSQYVSAHLTRNGVKHIMESRYSILRIKGDDIALKRFDYPNKVSWTLIGKIEKEGVSIKIVGLEDEKDSFVITLK
jgi:hypothetical protein